MWLWTIGGVLMVEVGSGDGVFMVVLSSEDVRTMTDGEIAAKIKEAAAGMKKNRPVIKMEESAQ